MAVSTVSSSPTRAMSTGSATPSAASIRLYDGSWADKAMAAPTRWRASARSAVTVTHTGRPTTIGGAGRPAAAAVAVIVGTMSRSRVRTPVIHVTVPSVYRPAR